MAHMTLRLIQVVDVPFVANTSDSVNVPFVSLLLDSETNCIEGAGVDYLHSLPADLNR